MTDRRSLSRRKLLWAAATVGAAASTGSGAAAVLSDSEQIGSEMTAGTLDLTAQWGNTDSTTQTRIRTGESDDTDGQKRVVLTVGDNPAYVWVRIPCKDKEKKKWGKGWSRDWGSWKGKYGADKHRNNRKSDDKHGRSADSDSFMNDGDPHSDGSDDILVRIGVDDGDEVRWFTGDSGSAFVSPSEVYEQFNEGVYLGQLDPGSDNAWEFVIDWKAGGVLMKSAEIDLDFTFYATQSRHVDPEMAKPDWDCDKSTGSGISWVAFCASGEFDKGAIDLSLSDDERTLSLSGVPDDVVDTVTIKHGTNLMVVTYSGQNSITVGDGDYSQVQSGFSGTNQSNPDPCPDSTTYCKYEFPDGWEDRIDDTDENGDSFDWDEDGGGHGAWGGWGGDD